MRSRQIGAQQPACVSEGNEAPDALLLRRRVEWLLSDTNLSRDSFLYRKISSNLPHGWIPFADLLGYRGIDGCAAEPEFVLDALKDSHLEAMLEEEGQGVWIRRRQPPPPLFCGASCSLESGTSYLKMQPCVDRYQTKNRLADLVRVGERLGIMEVGNCSTLIFERCTGEAIARGYERVVYGDHGPYIELSETQVRWSAWPHFWDKSGYSSLETYYYDEYYTAASHDRWQAQWKRWAPNPFAGVLLLYDQKQDVQNRPWAPGTDHAYRPCGYADYRPGYYYVAADDKLIKVHNPVADDPFIGTVSLPARPTELPLRPCARPGRVRAAA